MARLGISSSIATPLQVAGESVKSLHDTKKFCRFEGQSHAKAGAVRARAELDFSMMAFHNDPMAYDQPEPGSRAALGRKKGY